MRNIKDTLHYKWFTEVWNLGNKDAIDKLMAADAIAHGIGDEGKVTGANQFKYFYEDFRKKYRNIHFELLDVISQDDMEASLCKMTATDVASGQPITLSGVAYTRNKNGQIVEGWNFFDFLSVYQQLGFTMTK